MRRGAIYFAVIALVAFGWFATQASYNSSANLESNVVLPDDAIVAVNVPASISDQEQIGKRAYDAVCADCHGTNGQGRVGIAPPFVHKIYEPSHHGDVAFVLAAQNGVRAHHWKFGNMPAVEGVTRSDILDIVSYIRALQRANGIN